MKFESMGEIFTNGRIINLDKASAETINSALEEVKVQKNNTLNKINNLLAEIQN